MTISEVLSRLVAARDRLITVAPGLESTMTDAVSVGDAIAQGDVILTRVKPNPAKGSKPLNEEVRLVPDESDGGRHFAVTVEGHPTICFPATWRDDVNLIGPRIFLEVGEKVDIRHDGSGHHGTVHLEATDEPLCVQITYQRQYDAETRRERRSRD